MRLTEARLATPTRGGLKVLEVSTLGCRGYKAKLLRTWIDLVEVFVLFGLVEVREGTGFVHPAKIFGVPLVLEFYDRVLCP